MFCCDTKKLGFARFATSKVITQCKRRLKAIHNYRCEMRRERICEILNGLTWRWSHFWVWVSLGLIKRPTRRSAIFDYFYVGCVPASCDVETYRCERETELKKILTAATKCEGNSIWLSIDAVNVCGL